MKIKVWQIFKIKSKYEYLSSIRTERFNMRLYKESFGKTEGIVFLLLLFCFRWMH